jgi:hypothetical protein
MRTIKKLGMVCIGLALILFITTASAEARPFHRPFHPVWLPFAVAGAVVGTAAAITHGVLGPAYPHPRYYAPARYAPPRPYVGRAPYPYRPVGRPGPYWHARPAPGPWHR